MAYLNNGEKVFMNLKELSLGKSAVITKVGGEGALRQHFLDMGIIPGTVITKIKTAPMGDPVEIRIHSFEFLELFPVEHPAIYYNDLQEDVI